MSRNLSHLSARKGVENGIFQRVKKIDPANADELARAHKEFHVGQANLLGAASFYDFLRPEDAATRARVCNGTACRMAGTQDALRDTLQQHFNPNQIGEVCCLGRCHENNAFQIDGDNYSGDSAAANIDSLLKRKTDRQPDSYNVASKLADPILTSQDFDTNAVREIVAQALNQPPQKIIDEVSASNLGGRGGANFPTGLKWKACANAKGDPKYIVCNADEGDPGSYSDRYLLEHAPNRLLLGMVLAGYAVGARTGIVYVRTEYPDAVRIINKAVDALRNAGCLGDRILDIDFSFDLQVVEGAGAYIVGEETALLASIEGQRPEVRIRPPYPTEEGLFRKPTVVNNVQTLALVPHIAQHGGDAFAKLGTKQSAGPLLVCLDGRFNSPGVYEVEMGTPLNLVLNELGGGFVEPLKAVQVGGPLGGVVPASHFDTLTLDHESFESAGFLLGHASIVAIPERVPMIDFMVHLFEFTAAESCGKCVPCRLGSFRGMEMLRAAANGGPEVDAALLTDLLETLEETSLCGLGGGLPLPIRNILEHFADELAPHITKGGAT